jgi:polysaccharide export outer membrane protein
MRLLLVLLVCSSVLVSAAQAPATAKPPATEQEKPDERPIAEIKAPEDTPAAVDPKTYQIGPEDVLGITVWKERELSGNVVVRPDGIITVPLIGELQVNNLTPREVEAKLKEQYIKLVNNPVVSVTIQSVRSKKYFIQGNVGRSGVFPLVVPVTILQALTMAGGPSEFANKKKIIIMRGDKRLFFNWNDVIKGKNLSQNIYIENGDFIIVK